jgi:hypothetical protein
VSSECLRVEGSRWGHQRPRWRHPQPVVGRSPWGCPLSHRIHPHPQAPNVVRPIPSNSSRLLLSAPANPEAPTGGRESQEGVAPVRGFHGKTGEGGRSKGDGGGSGSRRVVPTLLHATLRRQVCPTTTAILIGGTSLVDDSAMVESE